MPVKIEDMPKIKTPKTARGTLTVVLRLYGA
jgi:hypothetical protein